MTRGPNGSHYRIVKLGLSGRKESHRPEHGHVQQSANSTFAQSDRLWAITLFPRGFDQVIPQVLALLLG
jgi:hypothetical protein